MESTTRSPGLHLANLAMKPPSSVPISALTTTQPIVTTEMRKVALQKLALGTPPSAIGTILPSPHPDYLQALYIGQMSHVDLFFKPTNAEKNNAIGHSVNDNNHVIYFEEWSVDKVTARAFEARYPLGLETPNVNAKELQEQIGRQRHYVRVHQARVSRKLLALQTRVMKWQLYDKVRELREKEALEVVVNDPMTETPGALENRDEYWRKRIGWTAEASFGYAFDAAPTVSTLTKLKFVAFGPATSTTKASQDQPAKAGTSATTDSQDGDKIKYQWSMYSGSWKTAEGLRTEKEKMRRARNALLVTTIGEIEREIQRDYYDDSISFILDHVNVDPTPKLSTCKKVTGASGHKFSRKNKCKKQVPQRSMSAVEFVPEDGGLTPFEQLVEEGKAEKLRQDAKKLAEEKAAAEKALNDSQDTVQDANKDVPADIEQEELATSDSVEKDAIANTEQTETPKEKDEQVEKDAAASPEKTEAPKENNVLVEGNPTATPQKIEAAKANEAQAHAINVPTTGTKRKCNDDEEPEDVPPTVAQTPKFTPARDPIPPPPAPKEVKQPPKKKVRAAPEPKKEAVPPSESSEPPEPPRRSGRNRKPKVMHDDEATAPVVNKRKATDSDDEVAPMTKKRRTDPVVPSSSNEPATTTPAVSPMKNDKDEKKTIKASRSATASVEPAPVPTTVPAPAPVSAQAAAPVPTPVARTSRRPATKKPAVARITRSATRSVEPETAPPAGPMKRSKTGKAASGRTTRSASREPATATAAAIPTVNTTTTLPTIAEETSTSPAIARSPLLTPQLTPHAPTSRTYTTTAIPTSPLAPVSSSARTDLIERYPFLAHLPTTPPSGPHVKAWADTTTSAQERWCRFLQAFGDDEGFCGMVNGFFEEEGMLVWEERFLRKLKRGIGRLRRVEGEEDRVVWEE